MDFLPIYLITTLAIGCFFGIFIVKQINQTTILRTNAPDFITKKLHELEHNLERSRTNIDVQQYIMMELGCPILLAILAYFISGNTIIIFVFIGLGFFIPTMILMLIKGKEDKKFEDRYVRALAQMAASLHSGMTVEQAIESVVNCELLHESVRDDFRYLASSMKLGTSISTAFYDFAKRAGNKDSYDVATAITIMTEVGGDAGEAIEKIQKNIEDRLLYRKKRESMLTESKIIAIFSDIMPIVILAGSCIFMPDAISSYFSSPMMMLIFGVVILLLFIGSVVVHKMLANKIDAS